MLFSPGIGIFELESSARPRPGRRRNRDFFEGSDPGNDSGCRAFARMWTPNGVRWRGTTAVRFRRNPRRWGETDPDRSWPGRKDRLRSNAEGLTRRSAYGQGRKAAAA